jgi:hypothetical protein
MEQVTAVLKEQIDYVIITRSGSNMSLLIEKQRKKNTWMDRIMSVVGKL